MAVERGVVKGSNKEGPGGDRRKTASWACPAAPARSTPPTAAPAATARNGSFPLTDTAPAIQRNMERFRPDRSACRNSVPGQPGKGGSRSIRSCPAERRRGRCRKPTWRSRNKTAGARCPGGLEVPFNREA